MPQSQDSGQTKHYKGFWPLFIILVIGAVAAIAVYWFQIQLVTDYDSNTTEIRIHKRVNKNIKPVKSPVKNATTKTAPTK